MEAPGGPALRACDEHEVFNLPLVEAFFVLDTRTDAEVAAEGGQRIATALPLPPPAADGSACPPSLAAHLTAFLAEVEEDLLWPAAWKKMLVYGPASRDAAYTDAVARALHHFVTQHSRPAAAHHKGNLFRMVEAVLVLDGGYPRFAAAYPMLCGVGLDALTPPPVRITEALWLRPRSATGLPIRTSALAPWGITHVVQDTAAAAAPPQPGWHAMPDADSAAAHALLHVHRLVFALPENIEGGPHGGDPERLAELMSSVVDYVHRIVTGAPLPSSALPAPAPTPMTSEGTVAVGGGVIGPPPAAPRVLLSIGSQAVSAAFAAAYIAAAHGQSLGAAVEHVQAKLFRRIKPEAFPSAALALWGRGR